MPTILTRYHDDLAIGAVSEGCTLSSLEAKVQPIQVSPCQAGLAGQRLSVSTRFLLSQHALVPFGFRRQVGWVTQKSSLPNFSFLQKGSINGLSGAHHPHTVSGEWWPGALAVWSEETRPSAFVRGRPGSYLPARVSKFPLVGFLLL